MEIKTTEVLYEGKTKTVYQTNENDKVLIHFHDRVTAFNAKKEGTITGKGSANQLISEIIFKELEKIGITTHFIRPIKDNQLLAKKLKIFPIEVVVRNVVAGSLIKRTGLARGSLVNPPLIELYYKRDDLNDPMLNDRHIAFLNLATMKEVSIMQQLSLKINEFLVRFLEKANLILVDFKLEFGLLNGTSRNNEHKGIILADEISPDTCRFWDKKTHSILDKDLFREEFSNKEVVAGYKEIVSRIKKLVHSS